MKKNIKPIKEKGILLRLNIDSNILRHKADKMEQNKDFDIKSINKLLNFTTQSTPHILKKQ